MGADARHVARGRRHRRLQRRAGTSTTSTRYSRTTARGPASRVGPCSPPWPDVTRRLRLGVMVTGNPYRHPAVLANMAASLDVISGGRLELGIGAGWNVEESTAYGIDLPPLRERFDRLEEACAVLDLLLTRETASFDGAYYRLTDARCEPKPVQRPRPPFVIGGGGEKRTLRIAARFADQWNLPGGTPEVLAHKIEVLHEHCADVGRDPAEIEVSVQVRAGAELQRDRRRSRGARAGGRATRDRRVPRAVRRVPARAHRARACRLARPRSRQHRDRVDAVTRGDLGVVVEIRCPVPDLPALVRRFERRRSR